MKKFSQNIKNRTWYGMVLARATVTSAMFVAALGLTASTAFGKPPTKPSTKPPTPTQEALALGSSYLEFIQGTYDGQTRVNPGPPGVVISASAIPNVWEYDIGTGQAFFNTWGATGLGQSAAGAAINDAAAIEGILAYANDLVADFNDIGNFLRSQTRPQATDVELLARLGGEELCGPKAPRTSKETRLLYLETAQDWWANMVATGDLEADRIIDGRVAQGNGDLAGWDVAFVIRAALAISEDQYACDAANQVLARRADWEGSSAETVSDYWHALSEGGLAYALDVLKRTYPSCGDFSADISGFRDQLLARQTGTNIAPSGIDTNGGIGSVSEGVTYYATQQTAFGILGLIGCKGTPQIYLDAAALAAGYLIRAQYPEGTGAVIAFPVVDPRPADGGWPASPDYFTDDSNAEINGEALFALALSSERKVVAIVDPVASSTLQQRSAAAIENVGRPPTLVEEPGQ